MSVTDRRDHTILGLRSEDFALTEGGVPQQIQSVSRWDVPASICVVFDVSGSMTRLARTAQAAVRNLLKDSGPEDEACLIRFAAKPELLADFSHDTNTVVNKLLWDRPPRGATALTDAVLAGLAQMRRAANTRRALVVITDGGENSSRHLFSELLSVARESGVQIFGVGLRGNLLDKEEQRGRLQLRQLADDTGGNLLIIDSGGDFPRALATVNELIRNQYVLTYRPANAPHDGKWHPVRVRIQPPSKASLYRVNARGGFYATK
ncbi:MAG: VWA domain-containing protein [Bryobacteraceae bacterium]|nr:VWA domain-containing protein [Bryobacteraceae bacterium]